MRALSNLSPTVFLFLDEVEVCQGDSTGEKETEAPLTRNEKRGGINAHVAKECGPEKEEWGQKIIENDEDSRENQHYQRSTWSVPQKQKGSRPGSRLKNKPLGGVSLIASQYEQVKKPLGSLGWGLLFFRSITRLCLKKLEAGQRRGGSWDAVMGSNR